MQDNEGVIDGHGSSADGVMTCTFKASTSSKTADLASFQKTWYLLYAHGQVDKGRQHDTSVSEIVVHMFLILPQYIN